MLEKKIEQTFEKSKFPKFEDIVDVKSLEQKKQEIAKLIFKSDLVVIKNFLDGISFSVAGSEIDADKILRLIESTGRSILDNSSDVTDVLHSYFKKNISDVLFAKFKEFMLDANNDKEEVGVWYEQIKEEEDSLFKKWYDDIEDMANQYMDNLKQQIKEDNQK